MSRCPKQNVISRIVKLVGFSLSFHSNLCESMKPIMYVQISKIRIMPRVFQTVLAEDAYDGLRVVKIRGFLSVRYEYDKNT